MSLHKSNTARSVLMGAAILFTSLQLRLAEPYHVVQGKLTTYTMWYGRCHLVFGRPGYVWLVEPYHMVPLESSAVLWDLSQYCFIFEHNTDANMLCRLFDDRKNMDIYLLIHQEYCYLGKQKNHFFLMKYFLIWSFVKYTTRCQAVHWIHNQRFAIIFSNKSYFVDLFEVGKIA